MGSRKNPILPMNLEETVGREMEKISLIVFRLGLKSFFWIVNFLGAKKQKVVILTISVTILNKIRPITAKKTDFWIKIGSKNRIKNILTTCSIIFEMVFGIIRWRPKKYPFNMEEMLIKGRVNVIAINK